MSGAAIAAIVLILLVVIGIFFLLWLYLQNPEIIWPLWAAIILFIIALIIVVAVIVSSEEEEETFTPELITPQEQQQLYTFLQEPCVCSRDQFTPGTILFATGDRLVLQNVFDSGFLGSTDACPGVPGRQPQAVTNNIPLSQAQINPWIVTVTGTSPRGFQTITLQLTVVFENRPGYLSVCDTVCCGLPNNVILRQNIRATWEVVQIANFNMIRLRNIETGLFLATCFVATTCAIVAGTARSNVYTTATDVDCDSLWKVTKVSGEGQVPLA
jgi:hypothetical protein